MPCDSITDTSLRHSLTQAAHLYCTRPCFMARMAASMPPGSMRVPSLGLGISPRGPRTLAMRVRRGIMSLVPRQASNSSADDPSCCILAIRSSPPMMLAPAGALELCLYRMQQPHDQTADDHPCGCVKFSLTNLLLRRGMRCRSIFRQSKSRSINRQSKSGSRGGRVPLKLSFLSGNGMHTPLHFYEALMRLHWDRGNYAAELQCGAGSQEKTLSTPHDSTNGSLSKATELKGSMSQWL